ncbi:MAG: protein kinase [Reyranella sp.]|uniref:protein kinase domain-containing protein n=1 Tax=Reyranella sp. TaxID=1929291 RepID=UPI001AC042A5|nr:protein kinase [Reyranella sp.]MBN9090244.1 protein kinase [Reyranella sp.]
MTSDNVQALPLGTLLGDYRLDAVIGHGGFGITYRAFDSQLAKVVAIKEYLPIEFAVRQGEKVVARGGRFEEDFAWGRDRFLDEARALARFRHPHIVPVLRFLVANGTAYTVMEFEDGRSVGELLHPAGRRLSADEARRLAEGLLLGLGAVHAQGFLHRDIKPSNIIIRRDGVPILIDFGAARQAISHRTRTLTSVLTPQYAPIEQYAAEGKQGPWSDIYSAAAVLHHAITGAPPPEAASRVGKDSYRPLAETQAAAFDKTFLTAIDQALAFAPEARPQSVADWSKLFGMSLPRAHDAPTQRMDVPSAGSTAPRLSGVSREMLPEPMARPHGRSATPWIVAALVLVIGATVWRYQAVLRELVTPTPPTVQASAPPVPPSTPSQGATPTPAPTPLPPPSATPAATPTPAPPAVSPAQKALEDPAKKAGVEARALFERAREAAQAGIAMRGEALIAKARAENPGLENAERVAGDDGSTYVGQLADGKREGLGVLQFKDGDRQFGEWKDNVLNGLGVEQLNDGPRYEGRWRNGLPVGLGVREKAGAERAEGNFASGKLEGLGTRRVLTEPTVVQTGEFKSDSLDGLGVEQLANGERYQGQFRAGKRHGYGQLIGTDERARASRWEDGKLVESTP